MKITIQAFFTAILISLFAGSFGNQTINVSAQQEAPKLPAKKADEPKKEEPKKAAAHGRGFKLPPKDVRDAIHKVNAKRHAALRASVPVTNLTSYDARPMGVVPPVGDQGQCGDCYAWSGCKSGANAQMAAGIVPKDGKFMLAVQYMNDYHPELGGCDGGDEFQVATTIHSGGCPSVAQYGGSGQGPGQKKPTDGMTMYTVASIVMVGDQSGVAATQDIKNYIVWTGYVSVAAAAGSDWDNAGPGQTITGNSSGVNHAIGLVGFDDNHDNGDGSKGAWIMQNNWSETWADKGYAWIKYGADSIGTEAFVCVAGNGPTPAGPAPAITSPLTLTAVAGAPVSYQIAASNSPTSFAATGLPAGLSVNATTGVISGTVAAATTATAVISATNANGTGTANLAITISATPPPPPGPPSALAPTALQLDWTTLILTAGSKWTVSGGTIPTTDQMITNDLTAAGADQRTIGVVLDVFHTARDEWAMGGKKKIPAIKKLQRKQDFLPSF